MPLPRSIQPERLRRMPLARFYFRYPLHHADFFPVRREGRLLGYAAAKPLYGRSLPDGRVDRSGGLDGRVAVLFVASPARPNRSPRILFARAPVERLAPGGRRDWKYIRRTARGIVRQRT